MSELDHETGEEIIGLLCCGAPIDPIQRLRDLVAANLSAGWAQSRLETLALTCDPAEPHVHGSELPAWICRRIREIAAKMDTVASLERERAEK